MNNIAPLIELIIAPSETAKHIWLNTFSNYKYKTIVREHLEYSGNYRKKINTPRLRIAYIGSMADHKGFSEWKEITNSISTTDYEIFYFGSGKIDDENITNIKVDFQDKRSPGMTDQLRSKNIDIVFLWSTWAETYCYTYYEALAAGCFVITNQYSGNIAAAVRQNKNGVICDNISEAVEYITNYPLVKELVKSFVDKALVPADISPNKNISDLLFNEQALDTKTLLITGSVKRNFFYLHVIKY